MIRYLDPGLKKRQTRFGQGLGLKILGAVSGSSLVFLIGAVIFVIFLFVIFAKDLPSPYRLSARDVSLSTKIYDRSGGLLYDVYSEKNRALISLKDLPDHIIRATVAIEDKDFYKHRGFAPTGILRAFWRIVVHRQLQGGSTITQQVVKNTLLTPERTVTRKIREFILALQVERRYTKDEILQIYLNEVPYGGTAWGIEAAAETYFGKKARELNLTESIILVGLPQKPTAYSPFGSNPKAYIDRAKNVARRMREDGYITREQEKEIGSALPNVQFATQGVGIKASHFVLYVRDLLAEQFGQKVVEQGGLQVTTTLDLKIQEEAEKIVAEEVAKLAKLKVGNGAAVVLNPATGEILAMVGSKDYFAKDYDGNVNVALAQRQPGSATKPINYAVAFKRGYTPASLLVDVPTVFPQTPGLPDYAPGNYDEKWHGPTQIRFTLGNSYNLPAVKMLALNGIKPVMQQAYEMGVTSWEPTEKNLSEVGLSLTLGGREVRLLDLTSSFGVFATGGLRVDPVTILKVADSKGKVLFEYKPGNGRRVLPEDVAFLISHILSDNVARSAAFGASSLLKIPGKTVAVKTGTTDQKRDNWTFGYTKSVVVGVWVGNNDNAPMNPAITSGLTGATPIWHKIIRFVLKDKPVEDFIKPDNVQALEIDAVGGGLPCPGYPTRAEYFIKGTEPTQSCLVQKKSADKEYFVFAENDPVSTDGVNRWQEGINAWTAAQPDEKYHPPAELLVQSGVSQTTISENEVRVNIRDPAPESQVSGATVIKAEALSGVQVEVVEFYLDNNFVVSKGSSEAVDGIFTFNYDFSTASIGDHRIEIRATNKNGVSGKSDVGVKVSKT